MKKKFLFILFYLFSYNSLIASEWVILLHGMARSSSSMLKLENSLNIQGFKTININYPSTRFSIQELSNSVITKAIDPIQGERIHFVTHSLGSILLRYYLINTKINNLGRVVMLGPPNQGSEVVDKLHWVPGFKWLNGPAGLQLGTKDSSLPNQIGKANFEVGIIAGNRSLNIILSQLIPGVDDGKVSIKRTKLEGMKDHIVVPVSHPFLMKDDNAIEQVIYFIRHGKFKR